jgi:predicted metal-dependent hydrolase
VKQLPPKALEGLALFNAGQYWKAHEVLEAAWLDEPGEIRELYRGILQAGVTYLHVERGNYRGALKVYARSQRWLKPFPAIYCGIHIAQLRQDLDAVIAEVRRLGPERMAEFDRSLLKAIITNQTLAKFPVHPVNNMSKTKSPDHRPAVSAGPVLHFRRPERGCGHQLLPQPRLPKRPPPRCASACPAGQADIGDLG